MNDKARGFTLVELLIVIVVIAILAAITTVAYSGIANTAHDTAVKNDLSSIVKKIHMFRIQTGHFPVGGAGRTSDGGAISGNPRVLDGVSVDVSKSSYNIPGAGGLNLIYCTGPELSTGQPGFRIMARSKSGISFIHGSTGGVKEFGPYSVNIARSCDGLGYPQTWAYGFQTNYSGWQSWTN